MTLSSLAPQVLLVDDEVEILHKTAAVLTAAGYRCQACTTPEAAVELALANPPDLILTDVSLGPVSGVQLCEEIRLLAGFHDVPVMFLSAAQTPDIIRRHNSVGAAYYLRKPIDPAVLVELIEHVVCVPQAAGV
jgi:two-component system chemotaxis response regulator CheY